jgi:aspartyl-tRNA(Asn)/glutamyl-tRNA(Gln) amidotransferase subunit C
MPKPRYQHQGLGLKAKSKSRLSTHSLQWQSTMKGDWSGIAPGVQALSCRRVQCYNNTVSQAEMKLDREQVQHIAWLARLGLTEAEIEKFSLQLSDILENFEILNEVDTSNVAPATQSSSLRNVLREDEAASSYPKADILVNAPEEDENCFKVKAILE